MSESLKTGKRMYATGQNGRSSRGWRKEKIRIAFIARAIAEQRKRAEARARLERADLEQFQAAIHKHHQEPARFGDYVGSPSERSTAGG